MLGYLGLKQWVNHSRGFNIEFEGVLSVFSHCALPLFEYRKSCLCYGMFILLDIDGVMLNAAPWKKADHLDDGFFAFETRAVSCLQKIVSETGASIVLTSSHKSKFSPKQKHLSSKKKGLPFRVDSPF